jgi:hypothetical protein
LQTPSPVEQVLFRLFGFIERGQTFSNDDVTGGAGAAHFARVLNRDVVLEQGFTNGVARRRLKFCTLRAQLSMGQDFDQGHGLL